MTAELRVELNAVIVAVTDNQPRVLVVGRADQTDSGTLPYGPLDPGGDRTLDLALRGWVREQTGLDLGYVEQLYTFGDRDRTPGRRHDERLLSIAYLALVREDRSEQSGNARWHNVYDHLPWEDWRSGRPRVIDRSIRPGLRAWLATAKRSDPRRERAEIAFGLGEAGWDGDRVLDRYELLYEAALVGEAHRKGAAGVRSEPDAEVGRSLQLDHRRILATALGRLRGKIRYRPVVFELLPRDFTLLQLQRVVEALAGISLHKQNFRRLVERGGLVEGTGRLETRTGGRPAELFRFRREVLRERPAPGVGLPGLPASGD